MPEIQQAKRKHMSKSDAETQIDRGRLLIPTSYIHLLFARKFEVLAFQAS